MTTQLLIDITPAPDGVRCGECPRAERCCDDGGCEMAVYPGPWDMDATAVITRGPACLAAAEKYRALREAGETLLAYAMLVGDLSAPRRHVTDWDAAVRQIEEGK